jgi:hypothetical protein
VTAEEIAKVVADLRKGRVRQFVGHDDLFEAALKCADRGPVVDVTSVFNRMLEHKQIRFYEDHPEIIPPWPMVQFGWVNTFGNVYVLSVVCADPPEQHLLRGSDIVPPNDSIPRWTDALTWETAEPINWDNVKYCADVFLWAGGQTGDGIRTQTVGPLYMWQLAIHEDGHPMDIHWIDIGLGKLKHMADQFDNALLVLLQSLNFLNCRNITVVEPKRERHERKRIERSGVNVHEITILPSGKTTRHRGEVVEGGVALHTVRGHFAHYGPRYGKGRLFGRLEGKFWVDMHARGSPEHGISIADYKLKDEGR